MLLLQLLRSRAGERGESSATQVRVCGCAMELICSEWMGAGERLFLRGAKGALKCSSVQSGRRSTGRGFHHQPRPQAQLMLFSCCLNVEQCASWYRERRAFVPGCWAEGSNVNSRAREILWPG